jgi:adenine-specific DNA-methyltransferase
MNNTEVLGQVFTPDEIVIRMLELRQNYGSIMEPSCGNGAFWERIKSQNAIGIEIDSHWCPLDCLNLDFFKYQTIFKFATIIGNPPYVAGKNIDPQIRIGLKEYFHFKTNLYVHFIDKCLDHLNETGELIFITPRDFIKLTTAKPLNDRLFSEGSITHWYECGEKSLFKGKTAPNLVIWRFAKNAPKETLTNNGIRRFINTNGILSFAIDEHNVRLGDLFDIRVGGVTGADEIFVHPDGNIEIVCSETLQTGKTRRVYCDICDDYIRSHKDRLINRGIKKFSEANWWRWGRGLYVSDRPRIYVNCKTRHPSPFFLHRCNNFDGAVLALFPKTEMSLERACTILNSLNWNELGFKYDGRFMFSHKSLSNALLPSKFSDAIKL